MLTCVLKGACYGTHYRNVYIKSRAFNFLKVRILCFLM